MLFLLTEDLGSDALASTREVYGFLGVEENCVPSTIGERFHRATVPLSMLMLRRIKGQGSEKRLFRLLLPFPKLRFTLRANQTTEANIVMNPETRRHLADLFRPENVRLAAFLGRDLSPWSEALAMRKAQQ